MQERKLYSAFLKVFYQRGAENLYKELVISVDVGEQPTTVHREVERADNILPNKKQLDKAERKSAFVLYYSKEQLCVLSLENRRL